MFTEVAVSSTTCLCQADQCHLVRSKSGQPLEERQEKEAAVWTAREGLLGQGLLLLGTRRTSKIGSQNMLGDLLDDLAGERWGKMLFLVQPLHFGVKVSIITVSTYSLSVTSTKRQPRHVSGHWNQNLSHDNFIKHKFFNANIKFWPKGDTYNKMCDAWKTDMAFLTSKLKWMQKIKTYVLLIDNKKFSKFQLSSNLVQVILAVRGGQRWVQVRDWLWTFRSGTFSIVHEKWR